MSSESYLKGFCQTAPMDRKAVRGLFNRLYDKAGLRPPTITVARSLNDFVLVAARQIQQGDNGIFPKFGKQAPLEQGRLHSVNAFFESCFLNEFDNSVSLSSKWKPVLSTGVATLRSAFAQPMGLRKVRLVDEIANHSPIWFASQDRVILLDRPKLVSVGPDWLYDSRDGKPAVEYKDGSTLFARRGTYIPQHWAEGIDFQKLHHIMSRAASTDHERVAFSIDVYGRKEFCHTFCHWSERRVSRQGFGTLHSTGQMVWNDLSTIKFLEVLNSTPNKFGEKETHFIRVPAKVRSPVEAVAWTFGMSAQEYKSQLAAEA